VVARAAARPALGVLSLAFVRRKAYERLGFRSLHDHARERLGHGARAVREWARVWEALGPLPQLRGAVLAGEIPWSIARRVVGLATPENDAACLDAVRGRTVRAVDEMLSALRESGGLARADADDEKLRVAVPLPQEAMPRWQLAIELARRMAGEALPVWACAEAIAAEALSLLGSMEAPTHAAAQPTTRRPERAQGASSAEHGLRHAAFPVVRWPTRPQPSSETELRELAGWAQQASPHALDRALRSVVFALKRVEYDAGCILRTILEGRLYRELGFASYDRYGEERVEVSPRTARRWVRLARAGTRFPELAQEVREGALTPMQATRIAEVATAASARGWLTLARSVTLRRLEEEASIGAPACTHISFLAPREAGIVFLAAVAQARARLSRGERRRVPASAALVWMLEHAIASWTEQGAQFDDYADFTRDGFRCTIPGCTARRNLHSHHIVFRSARGADEAWNRTTLCAFHHQRGVHGGTVRCTGRAPDELLFELGVRSAGRPLLRARSGDLLVSA
jgi:hypothetical protein